MSIVTIRDVTFLNNPAKFSDEYQFRVTFECIAPLKEDLEWKLLFVSSPEQDEYDQELDDYMVGPVPVGVNSFTFSAPPPDPKRIPRDDVIGVAAIILTASYKDQEFVRVGYYQNTEYDDPKLMESIRENGMHPGDIKWDMLVRQLLADKPRVTRFTINWDTEEPQQQPPVQGGFQSNAFPPQQHPVDPSYAHQQQFQNQNQFAPAPQPQPGYSFPQQQQGSSLNVPPAGAMEM